MNEILIANLTLDTTRKNNIPPLVVPQGDYGARVIRAKITDLGKPVIVESTAAASIVATRSGDGESKAFSGRVNADGTVTVPVKQWMLDVPEEDVTCHIEVTSIVYKYSTTSFLIEPQEKANPTEISEDDPRVDVVTEVLAGENTRRAAEAERVSNENARIAAENARQSAEEQRLTDESTRITNEAQRVSAEASRDATFRSWSADIASLPTFDGRISANRKRIENLESGIPAESFIIDDSVAYTKDVPENVAPNAVVQKVGGMTRKCANLIPFPYLSSNQTTSGVTITANNDGGILVNGTATSAIFFSLNEFRLNAGTYTLRAIANFALSTDLIQVYALVNGAYHWGNTSFTLAEPATVDLRLRIMVGGGATNGLLYATLNEGSTAQPYEPYFEGLRSAKVTEVKSVGVNLINLEDAVTDKGSISVENDSIKWTYLDNTNYVFAFSVWVDVKPHTDYTIQWTTTNTIDDVYIYTDKLWGTALFNLLSGQSFNTGEYKRLLIGFYSAPHRTGTETISNIILKEDANAPYAPYVEHTLPIPEAVRPANGINENVYDFIEWAEDGSIKKTVKCGVVDLGEQQWNKAATSEFYADIDDNIVATWEGYACLCAKYTRAEQPTVVNNGEMVLATKNQSGTAGRLFIVDNNYTDAASFKAAMSGVMLVYELAEPEVTDISDLITADNLVPVQSGGTMTPVNEYGYAVPSTIIYQLR